MRDLGGVLRERREAMGASLAEVETATRIRQKYLAALESDDWHLLPGEVVGRGFLRNYATYLGLDATELVERRRAISDPSMSATLAGTSAASSLPPERDIDYRPKDVALMDEPEGIQQREIRTAPFFRTVGILAALLFLWWFVSSFGATVAGNIASTIASVRTSVAPSEAPISATATPALAATTNDPSGPIATLPQTGSANVPVSSNPDSQSTTNANGENG
ncbi:MAG: helix-turn-helix domain-containing protein, partial [Caldilineaceae bacterium]|nr:helix-turn-helix domain-containing protein [Caldilineaceae bacterium]